MNRNDRAFFNKLRWNLEHGPLSEEMRPHFLRIMAEWEQKSPLPKYKVRESVTETEDDTPAISGRHRKKS